MTSTSTAPRKLILASSSPRRQELIRIFGLPVAIRASRADETTEEGMAPAAIVEQLSLRKAQAVASEWPDGPEGDGGIVIGSDTIVVLDGRVLGKPRDRSDAVRMLSALQGRAHEVYSGVACLDLGGGERRARPDALVGHTVSRVTFRPMSGEEIEGYVRTGDPLDKAGSYGVQGLGAVFIEKIEGDFYSVMGLPLNLLYQMLLKFDISPFQQK